MEGLALFHSIATYKSVSATARNLEVPRSTLSRKLGELEASLGVRLFHRTTRKLTLTAAGKELFVRTRRLLQEATEARDAVRRLDGIPRGTLHISIPFAHQIVEPLLRRFLALYPEMRVEAVASARLVDLKAEGYDLALRAGEVSDPGLITYRVGVTPIIPMASPEYLAQNGCPRGVGELRNHECLLGVDGRQPRTRWQTRNGNFVEVSGRLVSNSAELLDLSALKGGGIALLPSILAAPALKDGRLIPVLTDEIFLEGPISLVHPYVELVEPRLRAFLELGVPYLKSTLDEQSKLWAL